MMKVLDFLKKYRDIIYIVVIFVFCLVSSSQCSKIRGLNGEIDRQSNNQQALTEQIINYKDELGRANAEKHAYQLTQEELRDSIGLLKRKNIEYISYINTHMNVVDTGYIPTIIDKDPVVVPDAEIEKGSIKFAKADKFGKSSRSFSVDIPYSVSENKLYTGNAKFAIDQDIFVEGWLEKNTKTNETFIKLRTDYPGVTFNSGLGIVAYDTKSYEKEMRKTNGIGIAIGPNFSFSYDIINQKIIPTVGFGLTIGYTYTPKIFQW